MRPKILPVPRRLLPQRVDASGSGPSLAIDCVGAELYEFRRCFPVAASTDWASAKSLAIDAGAVATKASNFIVAVVPVIPLATLQSAGYHSGQEMFYREFFPPVDLSQAVERYWYLEAMAAGPQRIFPDGHTELVVHLGDGMKGRSESVV